VNDEAPYGANYRWGFNGVDYFEAYRDLGPTMRVHFEVHHHLSDDRWLVFEKPTGKAVTINSDRWQAIVYACNQLENPWEKEKRRRGYGPA
jgi:hypothetical protein